MFRYALDVHEFPWFSELSCSCSSCLLEHFPLPANNPDCASCEEGYAPGLLFSCSSCSNGNHGAKVVVAAILLVLTILVVAILIDLTDVRATPARKNRCTTGFRRLKDNFPFQSLKIAVLSWSIITQASTSFPAAPWLMPCVHRNKFTQTYARVRCFVHMERNLADGIAGEAT